MEHLSILEAHDLLVAGKVSSVELTQMYLKNIKESDLNAFITVCDDLALEAARKADEAIGLGQGGFMAGIPIGVKDAFCTKGVRTTMASKMLENFVPEYESTVTERLFRHGAVMLGKLNMDEFAMGSRNKNSYFGQTYSPWKIKGDEGARLIPGGSSGGSAAAVAGGLCVAALGTDTGGSVRQPAAFCGLVGFKPSYGACSRYGMIAYASSLDQAGFLTKTVKDAAAMFQVVSGHDGRDSTVLSHNFSDVLQHVSGDIKGLKVGIPKEFLGKGTHPEILANLEETRKILRKLGAEVVEISLPSVAHAIKLYYFISTVEASSNFARFDGVKFGHAIKNNTEISYEDFISANRGEGFGSEVKNRILIGTGTLMAGSYEETYRKAMRLRGIISDEFKAAFREVDFILNQTTPNLALRVNETQSPIEEYLNDILTVPINIAGLSSVAIPTVLSADGRPIGMQLTAKPFDDIRLLNAAFAIEREYDFVKNFSALAR